MDWNKISAVLADQPAYRLKQARQVVFKDLIDDWGRATSLPIDLRQKLAAEAPLGIEAKVVEGGQSDKAVITLADGAIIETVLIKNADGRQTVCVSSQVGCPLGCAFCATGRLGFKRNLRASEIVSQLLFWQRRLAASDSKVNNLVFMGMGEPLLNYSEVMAAIRQINDADFCNLGARHISISTAGIIPGIEKLAKENLQINLAISLHAADDELRSELMPVNREYPLKELMAAVDEYILVTGRQVMIEYLLIKDVNDRLSDAKKLARLVSRPLYMVNLLHYNPTGTFAPSEPSVAQAFQKALAGFGIRVTMRHSAGAEIAAACGQLAANCRPEKKKSKGKG
ncbi:MAG: 23S rRNA (adenine(2503)-C(2))-methyltransferase RlmN [Candidatus Falkowbacteria bacterium]